MDSITTSMLTVCFGALWGFFGCNCRNWSQFFKPKKKIFEEPLPYPSLKRNVLFQELLRSLTVQIKVCYYYHLAVYCRSQLFLTVWSKKVEIYFIFLTENSDIVIDSALKSDAFHNY